MINRKSSLLILFSVLILLALSSVAMATECKLNVNCASGYGPLDVQFTSDQTLPQGNYVAKLTLTDQNGNLVSTNPVNINVVGPASTAPVACFTVKPAGSCAPLSVQFTDTSKNSPTKWKWNFGDTNVRNGGTSSLQNPVYAYKKPGKYTVTLIASNAGGSGTKKITISVILVAKKKPVADFGAKYVKGKPLSIQFIDKSLNCPAEWKWNFGDMNVRNGGTSNLKDPVYTYKKPGKYTVTLTVKNSKGSDSKKIRFVVEKRK